jgi:hypothetical protein
MASVVLPAPAGPERNVVRFGEILD